MRLRRKPTNDELIRRLQLNLDTLSVDIDYYRAQRDRLKANLELQDAEIRALKAVLGDALSTIDRWDATIGQPPDPPSAEEVLFSVRDILRVEEVAEAT